MKKLILKIKKWYGGLPEKKKHIELITALLSVPMMVTVIAVNMNNIKSQKEKTLGETDAVTPIQVIIDTPQNATNTPTMTTTIVPTATYGKTTPTPTPTATPTPTKTECKKDIGVIEILSPQESEVISTEKVCINISTDSDYCPVTWSYKLDNDNWSEFNNNDICLYNLTPGQKQLQIRVKSSAIDKTITLQRNFIYKTSIVSPTASPSATPTP